MWSYRIYNGGGGGPVVIPPEAGNLTGIVVTKLPYKVHYDVGEDLDVDGLQITALFDNDVTADVTNGCTVEVETPLVKEETKAVVTYEGFSTSFNVNVYSQPLEVPPGTVCLYHFENNIDNEIESSPCTATTNSVFTDGKFHTTGIKTVSTNGFRINTGLPTKTELNNGAVITIAFWYKNTATNLTSSSGTDKNILNIADTGAYIIHYSNNIYAVNNVKTSFSGTGPSYNDWVYIAVVIKDAILKLFVNGKKIGESELTTNSGSSTLYNFAPSTKNVFIDELLISTEALYEEDFIPPTGPYGGKRILHSLIVESQPAKTDYLIGESFSLDGAVIKAVYSDGTRLDITSECVIIGDGIITDSTNIIEVQYTYNGITKNVFINIGRLSE